LAFIKKEDTLITTDGEIFSVVDIEALNAEFINYLNYGGYPEAVLSITAPFW
jgi:hypothetical protein